MKNQIIDRIKTGNWEQWAKRRLTMRLAEHWLLDSLRFKKFFGTEFPDLILLNKDEVSSCYLDKSQMDKCLEFLINKLYSSSFYDIYEKRALEQFKFFSEYCKKIKKKKLSKLKNQEILDIYNDFIDKEDDFTSFLWIIFSFDYILPSELEKELKEYLKKIKKEYLFEEYQKIILTCDKKTSAFDQSIDILKLAKKAASLSKEQLSKEIQKLRKKYHFFTTINFDEEPFEEDYFYSELNAILEQNLDPNIEIKKIKDNFKINKANFNKLIKGFRNEKRLYTIAESCHKVSYYRDYRNDVRRKAYLDVRKLYQEIAKRLKMSLTDLLYLTREDIKESILSNKPNITKEVINSRKNYFALILTNKSLEHIYDGQEIEKILNILEPQQNLKEIKGTPASPGKITGKVKIILIPQRDSSKLDQGDILVTSMTNIDFVPLMSKSSAIITDEGGLLCHAAIVSRELKKPCIVGTKIATKMLKDKDIIEVDANLGIIKKLS